ncbi:mRNA m6A methyltransferase catalytic subunit, partial [Phenoliferia sp. Uapishka_3]
MDSCRYVHWALEDPGSADEEESVENGKGEAKGEGAAKGDEFHIRRAKPNALPPQWINVDLRGLDVSTLGKFHVVVADPPWAIHQELPYGTLTDDEMMRMPVGSMQDEGGLLFLWVTGRAMELGRECLAAWGYERIDELIWVKTNQLQGLIRTGRTGHWLNHSKEVCPFFPFHRFSTLNLFAKLPNHQHCLVAIRRSPTKPNDSPVLPSWFQKGLDTQVLLAEVRETSRKPDELYDMVERILGGKGKGRKVELFGREHNLRDGWLTLGNQFGKNDQVFEEDVVRAFGERYPERGHSHHFHLTPEPTTDLYSLHRDDSFDSSSKMYGLTHSGARPRMSAGQVKLEVLRLALSFFLQCLTNRSTSRVPCCTPRSYLAKPAGKCVPHLPHVLSSMHQATYSPRLFQPCLPQARKHSAKWILQDSVATLLLPPAYSVTKLRLRLFSGIGALATASFKQHGHSAHLVCSSGGNAGLACAHAAMALGLRCTIFVPLATKPWIVSRIEGYGAEVVKGGAHWFEADQGARKMVDEQKEAAYVPPFDHELVVEGNATIMPEIMDQLREQKAAPLAAVIASVGGGGLLAGILSGMQESDINVPVLACETSGAASFLLSHRASFATSLPRSKVERLPGITSIATTLGATAVSESVIDLLVAHPAGVVSVVMEDERTLPAIRQFTDDHAFFVEPACAVTLAPIYDPSILRAAVPQASFSTPGEIPPKDAPAVVVVVCGGSTVTLEQFLRWEIEAKGKELGRVSLFGGKSGIDVRI